MTSNLSKYIISFFLLLLATGAGAQTTQSIRNQQRRNQQRITTSRNQQAENEKTVKQKLNELELLDAQIATINKDVRQLQNQSDSINRLIRPVRDSIAGLNQRLESMQSRYISALKRSQITKTGTQSGMLAFIFTSENFSQAWQRYRSLQQFSRWQQRKSVEIKETRQQLEEREARLDTLRKQNNALLDQARHQRQEIESRRSRTDRLVASLRQQSRNLDKIIKKYEKEARDLDRKLEEAIQREIEERRKQEERERRQQQQNSENQQSNNNGQSQQAQQTLSHTTSDANRQLTGDFVSNKGRLPFPIIGNYDIVKKFGRQKHPRLPKVETNNSGIDIEATTSSTVHAVFKGEVSQIFKLPGYHNVIVVRHGDYVTVYAGLSHLDVKKGDSVTTGQTLGKLWADPQDNNRSVLHFELRHEKEKENPELWLKP